MTRKRFKKLMQAEYVDSYLQMRDLFSDIIIVVRHDYRFFCRTLRDAKLKDFKDKVSYQEVYDEYIARKYKGKKNDAEKM